MTIKTQPPKVSVNAVVRENFTQKQAYLREQEKQQMNSFLFSRLVVSDSSWLLELQHTSLPVPHHLLKFPHFLSTEFVMPPTISFSVSLFCFWFRSIRVFSSASAIHIRWPKYCSFGICPSKGSIQVSSVTQSCPTLCNPMDCSMPGFPVHHQLPDLLKFMSIESVMPSKHLILCHPLLLLPSIFPSIRVFSSESVLRIRWPKYWSFSFSISPSNEYSVMISFRMHWFDLLAAQGTLKGLLQHHSSKASILRCSAFFIVQLSHPHMTIGKTIALSRWIFVGKVMSLLFNMLSRLVIAFLPRCKCPIISWLQIPSAVILEPRKIVCPCFHCFPIYLPWSDGTRCHDFSFLNVEF